MTKHSLFTSRPKRRQRPRDTQRSRLYAADAALRPHDKADVSTIVAIESYVAGIWAAPEVRAAFPMMWQHPPYVRDGRGRRSAAGCASWISMPKHYRQEGIVLHELAHTIVHQVYGPYNVAGHGPEYCGVYLKLVELVMGEAAHGSLRRAFLANGVDWVVKSAPRPAPVLAQAAACKLDGGG